MNARSSPTPSPNTMPSASECTLRANTPMRIPAMMPLIVEPITMPAISARASGVNQAVIPSMAPRIAPNRRPKRTLFIGHLPPSMVVLPVFLSFFNGVSLTARKQNKQNAHKQINRNQNYRGAMPGENATRTFEQAFRVGAHRFAIQIVRDVGGHPPRRLVARVRTAIHRFFADCSQWTRHGAGGRRQLSRCRSRQHERQDRTERE